MLDATPASAPHRVKPMTARDHFRALMRERRHFPPGSLEHEWRTRAARKLAWMVRGIPTTEWTE